MGKEQISKYNILIYTIIMFLWACQTPKEHFLVSILTKGIPAQSEFLLAFNDGTSYRLNSDSLGKLTIKPSETYKLPASALLSYQNMALPLYINENTEMEVFIDFSDNVHAEFYGNDAYINEIWNGKHLLNKPDTTQTTERQYVEILYKHLLNNYWLLDSIVPQDSMFCATAKQKYANSLLEELYNYLVIRNIHNPSAESREFVECILTNEDMWNKDLVYTTVLTRWIDWIDFKEHSRRNVAFDTLRTRIDYVDSIFSTKPVKEFVVNHLAVNYLKQHGLDSVRPLTHIYETYVSDSKLASQFHQLCNDTTLLR